MTETHDSRPDPCPGPVRGANPALGAPTHPESTPQESSAASPAGARTRRRVEGSRPARTPPRCCTGAKAPNTSPAFPGPPGPRRPPSLPGLEAGAAAAAAAAGGGGDRGSGFVGPGGSGGWCRGAGRGGGGRGLRRRVGEAGGRVVPVHRGGCVGRAGCSGGSSRALCEGGGRGGKEGGGGRGGRGRGRTRRRRRRRRELPPHMAPAGGRAEGALASLCLGNPGRGAGRGPAGRQGRGGIRGPDSRWRRRRRLRPMLVDFPGCTSRPPPPGGLAPPPLGAPRSRLAGLRRHRPPLDGQSGRGRLEACPAQPAPGTRRGARQP